ncbi:MAG: hypothetical protein LBE89_03990 [Helicobacteraceae bacterium]|jgi:hypothetical protein|nr:hypothetical protein [Helicobacteraceae bacterium]
MKKTALCLFTLLVFSGCELERTDDYQDERTGASVEILQRVTIDTTARTRLKISIGDNQSAYISASINGYRLFSSEYLTASQVDILSKHLVCDTIWLGGGATLRCGWTQRDSFNSENWTSALAGNWGSSSYVWAPSNSYLRITITVSDRKKGDLRLYINNDGYLY